MILLPSLYLRVKQTQDITVSFIIAEMKHRAMQGEDMAHRLGSK
jgi:nickel-dependent lactate racemase